MARDVGADVLVMDTELPVAAIRRPFGASAALQVLLLERRDTMSLSVALALEYEATSVRINIEYTGNPDGMTAAYSICKRGDKCSISIPIVVNGTQRTYRATFLINAGSIDVALEPGELARTMSWPDLLPDATFPQKIAFTNNGYGAGSILVEFRPPYPERSGVQAHYSRSGRACRTHISIGLIGLPQRDRGWSTSGIQFVGPDQQDFAVLRLAQAFRPADAVQRI
jgi:hypothetical protein